MENIKQEVEDLCNVLDKWNSSSVVSRLELDPILARIARIAESGFPIRFNLGALKSLCQLTNERNSAAIIHLIKDRLRLLRCLSATNPINIPVASLSQSSTESLSKLSSLTPKINHFSSAVAAASVSRSTSKKQKIDKAVAENIKSEVEQKSAKSSECLIMTQELTVDLQILVMQKKYRQVAEMVRKISPAENHFNHQAIEILIAGLIFADASYSHPKELVYIFAELIQADLLREAAMDFIECHGTRNEENIFFEPFDPLLIIFEKILSAQATDEEKVVWENNMSCCKQGFRVNGALAILVRFCVRKFSTLWTKNPVKSDQYIKFILGSLLLYILEPSESRKQILAEMNL